MRRMMRLSVRKKKEKKDLFDALVERNCILRFVHFLHKLDDKHLSMFNFWLEALVTVILYGAGLGLTSYLELYRYNASCYDSESTRICNEYLSSLPLSTITSKLLEDRTLATPYLFLLAQSEVWEELSVVLFNDFQTTKGSHNKISHAKQKRVCESQARTVALVDQYIKLRKHKEAQDALLLGRAASLANPGTVKTASGNTSSSLLGSTPTVAVTSTKTTEESSKTSKSWKVAHKHSLSCSESDSSKKKRSQSNTDSGYKKGKTSIRSEEYMDTLAPSSTRTESKSGNSPRGKKPASLGGAKQLTPRGADRDNFPMESKNAFQGKGPNVFPSKSQTFPDLSVGRLASLDLPTISSFWLDFALYLAFKQYLASVFSQDSLNFYIKTEHYRLVLDEKQRPTVMREIYSHYIERSIVHVTSRQNMKIRSQFATSPPEIFQEVAMQIYDLLRFQWIDFVFSPYYRQCVAGTIKLRPTIGKKPTSSVNCFLELRDYYLHLLEGIPRKSINKSLSPTNRHSQTEVSSSTAFTSTLSCSFASSSFPSTVSSSSRKTGSEKEKECIQEVDPMNLELQLQYVWMEQQKKKTMEKARGQRSNRSERCRCSHSHHHHLHHNNNSHSHSANHRHRRKHRHPHHGHPRATSREIISDTNTNRGGNADIILNLSVDVNYRMTTSRSVNGVELGVGLKQDPTCAAGITASP